MGKQILLPLLNCSRQWVRLGGLTAFVAHPLFRKNRRSNIAVNLIAVTLLLTCLPLLATAQLVPLKTFQASLFAQTPQKSEKTVDKTEKKQRTEKAKDGEMDGKQYKDESRIKVKDPALFPQSEKNKIFSGPQPGEELPALMVTGIGGELDGQAYDITATADGKPLVLFLQDTSGVGVKGLVGVSKLLLKIDAFQKTHSKTTDAEKSNQGLQIGVVLLADDLETLPEGAHNMLKTEALNTVLTAVSSDGREGPGSYGLNRNVAQTVLIAKDRRVLHNFAFTQPMLYPDPHFLGAIAQAIEVEPATLEKWLNNAQTERYTKKGVGKKSIKAQFAALREAMINGKISKEEAAEGAKKLGITWEEGEQLLKKTEGDAQAMRRERQGEAPAEDKSVARSRKEMQRERTPSRQELVKQFDKDGDGKLSEEEGRAARRTLANTESQTRYRRENVEVKNPAEFKKVQGATLFSGPQPGEKLPPLMAKGINGDVKDKTYDVIAKADGQLLVLFLQDESGLGLRGLVGISGLLAQIAEKSEQAMYINVVFLDDAPDTIENQISRLVPHIPNEVLLGVSQEGREGPGSYGLNRNVAQTVIIAKDGKVLHNFAFAQPMLHPNPYLLGAVGDAIGVQPVTLEKWLNVRHPTIIIKNPAEGEEAGRILLNGDGVQFDELSTRLLNLPEEQKSTVIIQAERKVLHGQVVKVMDIAKEAGIEKIEFRISPVENKSMKPDKAQERRSKDSD